MPHLSLRLLAALLALALGAAVSHAPAALEMGAEVGFDGFYVPGEWTPVRVVLSNMESPTDTRPPRDLVGLLSVRCNSHGSFAFEGRPFSFETEVDLPANSRKQIWLLVKAPGDSQGTPAPLQVEFRATNRRARVTLEAQGRVVPPEAGLVVVARPPGLMQGIRVPSLSATQSHQVAAISELPDRWAAYQGVTALFLAGASIQRITAPQAEALREWVRRGGTVVVDGGAGGDPMLSPIADLLPVSTAERATWRMTASGGLEPLPEGADPEQEALAVLRGATLRGGATPLWLDDRAGPLVAFADHGMGRVGFLGWSLSDTALDGHPRAIAALGSLVPPAPMTVNRERLNHLLMKNIIPDPDVAAPSAFLVLLLLVAYFVVVGPWNFLYLRKRQRIEWAWITIPLIIAVFCAFFFVIGYFARSNSDSIRHVNIATLEPGGEWARVEGLSVYFSATKQRVTFTPGEPGTQIAQASFWEDPALTEGYNLELRDQMTDFRRMRLGPTPMNSLNPVGSGDPASVRFGDEGAILHEQPISQWTFTYIEGQGLVPLEGGLEARCEIYVNPLGQLGIRGHVRNRMSVPLRDCALVWANRCILGKTPEQAVDLQPGEVFPFDRVIGDFVPVDAYEQRMRSTDETLIRLASLRSVTLSEVEIPWLNPRMGEVLFLAHMDEPLLAPEPDRLAEREEDHTLLVMPLSVAVASPTQFSIGSSLMPRSVTMVASDPRHIVRSWTPDTMVRGQPFQGPRGQYTSDLANGLMMRSNAAVMISHRLPWSASGARSEVERVSVHCRFQDSGSTTVRLYALNRAAEGGEDWIEVPIHTGGSEMAAGMPSFGPHPLPAGLVVDPTTDEITLMMLAEADPNSRGDAVVVHELTLTVEGLALPPAGPSPQSPPEEIAS